MFRIKTVAKGLYLGVATVGLGTVYYKTNTLVGACYFGDLERSKELATPEAILAKDIISGKRPIEVAISTRNTRIIKLLAEIEPKSIDANAVMLAVRSEGIAIFQSLVESGLDPRTIIKNDFPVLFYLIACDRDDLLDVFLESYDVDLEESCHGELPIIFAAKMKSYKCVNKLLPKVNLSKVDSSGEGVLHILALDNELGSVKLTKDLVNQQNLLGVSPFMYAVMSGQIELGLVRSLVISNNMLPN